MSENEVINLLKKIEHIGIEVWIDGGWGVDALLGQQTRQHNDIDIFVQKKDSTEFIEMLISSGYSETKVEFTTNDHTVWRNIDSQIIDLHLFEFVGEDRLRFNNEIYPSYIISGEGIIGGICVRCFTVESQLLYHQGYEHKEKDEHDVHLLCKTFKLPIPEQYEK